VAYKDCDSRPYQRRRTEARARPSVQFSFARLLGAMTCLAVSAGVFRYTYFEVQRFGGGFYPMFCLLTAITLIVTAVALISPKTGAFAAAIVLRALEFLLAWL